MFFFKGFTATVILFIVERSLVYGNCSHCHSLCLYTAPPHPDIILPVHQRMPSTYPLVSVMLCSLAGICLSHCYLVPFLFHLCRHPVVCIIGWLNKNKKKYYHKKKIYCGSQAYQLSSTTRVGVGSEFMEKYGQPLERFCRVYLAWVATHRVR